MPPSSRRNRSSAPPRRDQAAASLLKGVKKGQRQANTVAEREGVAADLPQQMPDDVPLTTAQEAWALAQQQADIYRKARQKLDGDLTALAERERGLSAREQQLDESR